MRHLVFSLAALFAGLTTVAAAQNPPAPTPAPAAHPAAAAPQAGPSHTRRRWQVSWSALRPEARLEGLPVRRRRPVVARDQVQRRSPHVPYPGEVAALPGIHPVHERVDEGVAAVVLPQLPEHQRHLLRDRRRFAVPACLRGAPAEVVDW